MSNNFDVARAVATAKIITPDQAAHNAAELAMLTISLRIARTAGAPLHIVQFEGGVTVLVNADPSDKAAWCWALAGTYRSVMAGATGKIDIDAV